MPRIGSVRVTQDIYTLYRNITAAKPTRKTERNLVRAYEQAINPKADPDARYEAFETLGSVFGNLKLEMVISGACSFIKPTLETITTNNEDQMRGHAAEIVGIEIRRRPLGNNKYEKYYQREDSCTQWEDCDLSERLLEATPAEDKNRVLILYAVAKHGARSAEAAGNQLALISLGAFANASLELKQLAGFLFNELVEAEVTFNRRDMWKDIGGLDPEHIFKDRQERKERARFFKAKYGIAPDKVHSVTYLSEILHWSREGMEHALAEYFRSLPQIVDRKLEKICVELGHYTNKSLDEYLWDELNPYLHRFVPLNPELTFIIPFDVGLRWGLMESLMSSA